jgi:hypothetical protein
MALILIKNNMESMFKNKFKENLDDKLSNSIAGYKKLKANDICRRYMKISA